MDQSNDVLRLLTGICFVFLSCLQASYGFKIAYLDKTQYDRFFAISPAALTLVNAVLVVSFFTRGVYQFLSLYSHYALPSIPIQGSDDIDLVIVVVFLLWDYLPTVLLIVTVTSRHVGTKPREGGLIRGLGAAFNSAPLRRYGSVDKSSAPLGREERQEEAVSAARRLSQLEEGLPAEGKRNAATALRGMERFEMPGTMSPKGSWLADAGLQDRPEDRDSAGSTLDPLASSSGAKESLLRRMNRDGSSGSESDMLSEGYGRRLAEKIRSGSQEGASLSATFDRVPYSDYQQLLPQRSQHLLSAAIHGAAADPGSRDSRDSKDGSEQAVAVASAAYAAGTKSPLLMRDADGVAIATKDRRLRRPLTNRESESVMPPDEG